MRYEEYLSEVREYSLMDPEGFTAYNFVGEIDGTFKIMRSVDQIPQSLIGDLVVDEQMLREMILLYNGGEITYVDARE